MPTPSDLNGRISSYKRRYKRTLQDMLLTIQSEIEHLDDSNFEPSSSTESAAFHLIQESNRLKSLLEVDE